ncbi:MAG: ATP-binding cassette domain-containing protein [Planctomycetaceae bacterium]
MIELADVSVRSGDYLLEGISFQVQAGAYAVLMGRTGIGKTTLLEAICGLRRVLRGRVLLGGVDVTVWSPADRRIGYMPQDLALFPTMTVQQHLEFAQRLQGASQAAMAACVGELAELLEIGHLLQRGVRGLSGGEAQRVALGRALAARPALLLLDEPISALDAETRQSARLMLKNLNRQTGVTVLHVTHDREDAELLGDVCLQLERASSGRVQAACAGGAA